MKLTGAQIIIETLVEQGCDRVFGYPGGQIINVYDELYKNRDRIRHIITAHEQGAAHAADGFARSTGKTGVVIATSGPGATNLVTGKLRLIWILFLWLLLPAMYHAIFWDVTAFRRLISAV